MKINHTAFESCLKKGFSSANYHLMTEDLVRQSFIDCQALSVGKTKIEYAYKSLPKQSKFASALNDRARADLYYSGKNVETKENEEVVIEFKYHKKISTSATDKTGQLGNVLRDLNRLSTLDNSTEKYFIYVFDQEMKNYYDKNWNVKKELGFLSFDKAKNGNTYSISSNIDALKLPKSTIDNAFSSFKFKGTTFADLDYSVKLLYNTKINDNFYLLILQVI